MSLRGKAYVVGAFEHPTRFAPDKSVAQLHAECAAGALKDAGLTFTDVDGYFCAGDVPGGGPLPMADYMNLNLRWADGTELGGCSYLALIGHAAAAIAAGKCSVALITLAGKPRSQGQSVGTRPRKLGPERPETPWDTPYQWTIASIYGMYAMRHMHEFGTTAEQMAWVKVAASHHAQHNPNALLRKVVTVEDVLASPIIARPLHKLDCCVITDGGGALVLVRPEIARALQRPLVKVIGCDRVCRGWRDTSRHQVRVRLRQLHHHGHHATGGPRVLQERRGWPVCRRWQPHLRRRQAALEHRWRWLVQQPSTEPGWHHESHRGRPAASWRSGRAGAGQELRPCIGVRARARSWRWACPRDRHFRTRVSNEFRSPDCIPRH